MIISARLFFCLRLGEHDDARADADQDRCIELRIQHLHGIADLTQRDNPCGHRGTDVRTHDDTDRLTQGHETRADETDNHDRGRTRTLDDAGNQGSDQHSFQPIGSQHPQEVLHFVADRLLCSFRHDMHAVEEHPPVLR